MKTYLKKNMIALAAQRATAVLSVVNHAGQKEVSLKEKIKVFISLSHAAFLHISQEIFALFARFPDTGINMTGLH